MQTPTTPSSTGPTGWATVGLAAGVVAAFVVLVPVLILQAIRGVGPLLELQLTASSLMGTAAYASTLVPALLGVLLHFVVSVVSGVVYALVEGRFPQVNRWAWVAGPVFGLVVFFVMGLVVTPLSAFAPPAPTTAMPFVPSLLIHMVGFGLPIALFVKHRANRQPA